jgi:anti-sigma-K factor RskA
MTIFLPSAVHEINRIVSDETIQICGLPQFGQTPVAEVFSRVDRLQFQIPRSNPDSTTAANWARKNGSRSNKKACCSVILLARKTVKRLASARLPA